MHKRLLAIGITFLAGILGGASLVPAADPALRVLFLGDRGHHRPADRAAQIAPVLATRGIEIVYTEDLEELRLPRLKEFAALLVYANIDTLADERAQAILAYVSSGGGYVPIHCASYCFRDQPRLVELLGAQFLRHETGEFDTQVEPLAAGHPILAGLIPFRTWDETYVHHLHHLADRTLLQTRAEGTSQEPWTWVRTHGKGRVFYTAYGHDGRTWSEPGFQALLERGIRWAANRGEVFDGLPRPVATSPSFTYEEADIPRYVPATQWGVLGEPIRRMQHPLLPEASAARLVAPRDFKVECFASEPQIGKPLAMAWDQRGRLWIAETVDYPNELQAEGNGRDQIKICDDSDGDGRADKFTIFAQGLSIPTSLAFSKDGVIVHQAPDTLLLRDVDGDDHADERHVILHGWGTEDTHAGPSNLRYGLDGWYYSMVGYSGFDGEVGGERHRFGSGLLRFRGDGSRLEFLRGTNNNSWGVGISEEGFLFGSTANGCPSVYMPIPNRYYEQVRGWSSPTLENIALGYKFYPLTSQVRQVDWFGGFTAGAGHALYTARAYPRPYWNRTAFVNEPTGHLTACFTLVPRGSDFQAYNSWNLLCSDDEWTAPIAADVGPDGQVWVLDWYNYIVQHNPTPQGFQTGRGGAYETPLRDKTRARIYRVVYGDADTRPTIPPFSAPPTTEELLAALGSTNMFWRSHAQRLLVEAGDPGIAGPLIELLRDQTVDDLGLNPAAIHALWTLHALGVLDPSDPRSQPALEAALAHPSAGVRRAALMALATTPASAWIHRQAELLLDPDAQVRLAAFLSLADAAPHPDAGAWIETALRDPRNAEDRWIPHAAIAAAARQAASFLPHMLRISPEGNVPPALVEAARRVSEHVARGGEVAMIDTLLLGLPNCRTEVAASVIEGLSEGAANLPPRELGDPVEDAIATRLASLEERTQVQFAELATRLGSKRVREFTDTIIANYSRQLADPDLDDASRIVAARNWIQLRSEDPTAVETILRFLGPSAAPELQRGLVDAISQSRAGNVGQELVECLPAVAPAGRLAILNSLLSRTERLPELLRAAESGELDLTELTLDQRQALLSHPLADIARRTRVLLDRGGALPDSNRAQVLATIVPQVAEGGDSHRGKEVFTSQCAKCHRHGDDGQRIGPDLTGMAAHPREEILMHLLDPSRSVEGNYRAYSLVTSSGQVLNGLLASETKTTLDLIDAEGKRWTVQRDEIEELNASHKSLMPEGFEQQLSVPQIQDLLAFLTTRGKYVPLDLHKVATRVSTRGMFYSEESEVERIIFDDWGMKTFADVPFRLIDPQGAEVPNLILLHGPHGTIPPQMPKRIELPYHGPIKAIHLLSGVSGWGFPASPKGTVSLTIRVQFIDGSSEEHPLTNGVHFADYIRVVDVPESRLAFRLRDQQLRYLKVDVRGGAAVEKIELIKGHDETAPLVAAITVEPRESP